MAPAILRIRDTVGTVLSNCRQKGSVYLLEKAPEASKRFVVLHGTGNLQRTIVKPGDQGRKPGLGYQESGGSAPKAECNRCNGPVWAERFSQVDDTQSLLPGLTTASLVCPQLRRVEAKEMS